MKPRGYLPSDATFAFRGLNTLAPSTQLSPNYSPNCKNIKIDKGIIGRRFGYHDLGQNLGEPVMALLEFDDFNGVKHAIGITTTSFYTYDADSDVWTDVTYVNDDDDRTPWTGTITDAVDWTIATGYNPGGDYVKWVIITNGKDTPRYWDGVTDTFKEYLPNIPGFVTCKTLTMFYSHIVLGNVTLSNREPQHLYWSDVQSMLEFTVTDGGEAGAVLLTAAQGDIWMLLPLGDRLMVYAQNSIDAMTYVGGDQIFQTTQILRESRLVSPRSVVNIGPYHLFLSQEQITLFDGTRAIRNVSDQIYRNYREELSVDDRAYAFASHDVAKQKVYFGVPIVGDRTLVYTMEYDPTNYENTTWTVDEFLSRPVSMGYFARSVSLRCNSPSLVGIICSQYNAACNQGTSREGWPIRAIGTSSAAVLADDIFVSDQASPFESFWDTIDFVAPQEMLSTFCRWIEFEIDAKGYEVQLYYSLDEGQSYTFIDRIDLEANWKKYKIPIDLMSPTIRFRLRSICTDTAFFLRWMRVWYKSSGAA